MILRKANNEDINKVWPIIKEVIATGSTYVFAPESPKEKMIDYWFDPMKHCYVAEIEGVIVGTFVLKDNQPDLGNHIANGSYIVASVAAGKGVGKAMGKFSIDLARQLGYRAIQFNIVIKSNTVAVKLWQSLGFQIIGEVPEAIRHPNGTFGNAYIMYLSLK